MEVTFSKQWIHLRRSDRWPPTSTILGSGVRWGGQTLSRNTYRTPRRHLHGAGVDTQEVAQHPAVGVG